MIQDTLHIHTIYPVGEVEGSGWLLAGTQSEACLCLLGCKFVNISTSLVFIREVPFNDVISFHVDLLIRVVLAVVDLFHAASFFNEEGIAIHAGLTHLGRFFIHLSNLQNILQAVESNLNDLVIWACKKVTKWLNASLRHEIPYLVWFLETSRCGV